MRVESFTIRLARPPAPLRAKLEEALRHAGRLPLRWAVVAVEGETLVIEGARLVACSPSST